MNAHRLREEKTGLNLTVAQVVRDMTDIRIDEHKVTMEERLRNWMKLYVIKPLINLELEELRATYSEEIEMIKQQQSEDQELYKIEREKWIAQKTDIDNAFHIIRNKIKNKSAELPSISYEIIIYFKNFDIFKRFKFFLK